MKDIYLGLKFALSYFSILPVKFKPTDDLSKTNILKNMILFFPFVGIVLSSVVVLIYTSLEPSWYTALLCSVLYMFFYGFLHTEAIADVADAIYASHSSKDAYKVIKDPTIGAMGLLYTTAFVILKIASLTFVLLHSLFFEFIVISTVSRLLVLFLIYIYNFKSTFVNALKKSFNLSNLLSVASIYTIISFILIGLKTILFVVFGVILSFIFIRYLKNRLGFLNGDVLGANLELSELIMLMILSLYMY